MALRAGTRLGPYEIQSALGAGGMGEVYRGRDTRLDRMVALKILPEALAADPQFRERFDREARSISQLTHPHICRLYDIGHQEWTGSASSPSTLSGGEGSTAPEQAVDYLVMEYLDGETLADRLGKGALPLDQALRTAIEIASALDAAHRAGIVHRDLKPGNIMLTRTGAKLLDFGLAKSSPVVATTSLSKMATTPPVAMTAAGTILGTFQYMSPEQLDGQDADARSDIFAFGAVVYEMLTGRPAFQGRSQATLIAAILEREPAPISTLQPATPPQLEHLVKRCLAKAPEDRWQTASDLQHELKWISEHAAMPAPTSTGVAAGASRAQGFRAIPVWLAAAIALVVGLAVWALKPSGRLDRAAVVRLAVALPAGTQVAFGAGPPLAISPDGTEVVYVSGGRLYRRAMDNLEAKPLDGTEGASNPFFSPDGQWVGFFAQTKLKKVSLTGGTPQTLADAPFGEGGSWGSDGMIYFAPSSAGGLSRVSEAGGPPQVLTKLDRGKGEISQRWPQILPGNKAVLFTTWTGPGSDEKTLEIVILESGERRIVNRAASTGRYVSTGYVVYTQAGALMAVPFDVARLQASGAPPVPLGVQVNELGEGAAYAVSDSGVLGYVSGDQQFERRLVWVDRAGHVEPLPAPVKGYENATLSPDGRFAAVQTQGPTLTIWIYDFARKTLTPLTSAGSSQAPLWTPDGKRIAYRGTRRGNRNVFWKAADGSGDEERLTVSENYQTPVSWSPDGKWLAFNQASPTTSGDAWVLPIDGDRKPHLFQKNVSEPHFSPDGRWIAYSSSESGRVEISVRPFQGSGARTQVSADGGAEAVWSRDGRELFYIDGDKTMAVDVQTRPTFSAGPPHVLFTGRFQASPNGVSGYDISADGKRFLKIQPTNPELSGSQINIVIGWFEELKRVTAGKR